ncbi:MAG: mechanosensitive ion channel family protein [Gammaproteobacteria bacterium]|nr:MAG: mechanosensitive ion channel family protein [Gammaproteobacteria bacterium]
MATFFEQLKEWLNILAPNPYIQAAVVLVCSYFLAKISDWLLTRILSGIAQSTKNELDDRFVELFHKPVIASIMLVGIGWAIYLIDLGEEFTWFTMGILWTIAIGYWMSFTLSFTRITLTGMSRRVDRFTMVQLHTLPLFNNLAMLIIIGLATYFVFISWGINVSAWIASAGIIGLALSFAAKDTLANLFAGVFILADSPYSLGHFIILESGERGEVTHIGIRSTRILTRDDVEITIPNAIMGNSKIINETGGRNSKMRIRIQVSVAYGSNIDEVRNLLMKTAVGHSAITQIPEPRVRFRRFGESGLDFELLCWISQPVLRGRILDALNEAVYNAFLETGIEIPYPKRDIYVKQLPEKPE